MEDWLRSIGLAHRIQAFRDQQIEADHLGDLTDSDLSGLGFTIGERIRFRRALAALADSRGNPRALPPPAEKPLPERRPLTVMFVDIVDSSGLAERLDSEDLLAVIRTYRESCAQAIASKGGHIAHVAGDGILACFCYPVATENDPERAVSAALDITRAIAHLRMPAGQSLAVRIGIATGRVVIGNLLAETLSVLGTIPNMAARLQALAGPGTVILCAETHARVQHLFACEDLGSHVLRGLERPHRPWRAVRALPFRGRVTEGLRPRRLTPFCNRVAELALLRERWARALDGQGGLVLVLGEAGIGKSRLIEKFLNTDLGGAERVVHIAASPLDQDSPLHPIIAHLRAASGIDGDDPPAEGLAKLEAVLLGGPDAQARALPLLAEMLGQAVETGSAPPLTPEQRRERTLEVLLEQILLLSARQPLCLVAEDFHWMDPTTRELLERVAGHLARRRIMLVIAARDGSAEDWAARHGATVIHLIRLTQAEVSEMMAPLFAGQAVPHDAVQGIFRKTDGIPLFVEEVARALLDAEGSGRSGDELLDELQTMVPASVHGALVARLDRSGMAKQIAQSAAVLGRSVHLRTLAEVSETPASELAGALATLTEEGVFVRDFAHGEDSYAFTHALLRDAAYDSLLRDRRRALHLRSARALLSHEKPRADQQPELIAWHLTEANRAEEAAGFWLEAGRRSLARSALTEAMRTLQRGLSALENQPLNARTAELRLQLSGLLGPALIGLHGPGSAGAQALYARALPLCDELPQESVQFPIYWGWWRVSQDFRTWLERSRSILERALAWERPEFILQAHHCNWASHYHAADFDRCCEHIAAGLALYHRGDYRSQATLFGNHDAKVCAHGNLAQLLWMQGRSRRAAEEEDNALRWAQRLDHLGSRVHAMDMSLLCQVYRRDDRAVFARAGELVSLASEYYLSDHRAKGMIFRGWITAIRDDPAAGLKTLEEGLARQHDGSTSEDFPVYHCLHAEALSAAGRPELAVENLTHARSTFERIGLRVWMPEVIRMLGEVMLRADPGRIEEAQALFGQSLALARQQGAAMLALRTAVSQARLDQRLGRAEDGVQRLATALRAVEDDGSADLVLAKRLLGRMRERAGVGE